MEPNDLATAFAVWAAVVGMIGIAIVWELSRLRAEIKTMGTMLNMHQLETQGRLTAEEPAKKFSSAKSPPAPRTTYSR